jgi:peptidoglycan/LPS O-acetylase OafA/YrhL
MPAAENQSAPRPEGDPARSRRAAKRRRRELARAREREQRRPLVLSAMSCGALAIVGLAATAVLALAGLGDAATWVAGPTGIAVLAVCGILVAIERTKQRKKERLSGFGRIGLGAAAVAGLQLIATPALFLAGLDQVSRLVGLLTMVPALFAVGLLGAEWSRDVPGDGDSSDSVRMMNDIVRHR